MNIFPEACLQMDILQGWSVVETIGSGSYGTVYKVRHDASGREAALKWIHIERNEKNNMSGDLFLSAQTRLLNEIGVLRSLSDTPEIVAIQDYAYQISPDGRKMDSFIRMELLTPLLELLKKAKFSRNGLNDADILVFRRYCDACIRGLKNTSLPVRLFCRLVLAAW